MEDNTAPTTAAASSNDQMSRLETLVSELLRRNEELASNFENASNAYQQSLDRIRHLEDRVRVQIPAPRPAEQPVRASLLRPTIPEFDGRLTFNAQRWFAQVEDAFEGAAIPRDKYPTQAVPSLRGEALAWYMQLRADNNDRPPSWEQFKTHALSHYNSTLRLEELRTDLRAVRFASANVLGFLSRFRTIAEQIPNTYMTRAEVKSLLLEKLPFQDQVDLRRALAQDATLEDAYNEIRAIAHTRSISSRLAHSQNPVHANNHGKPFRFKGRRANVHGFGPSHNDVFAADVPMDVDLNTVQAPNMRSRLPNPRMAMPAPSSTVRCYNCNVLGHKAHECRSPRTRPLPPNDRSPPRPRHPPRNAPRRPVALHAVNVLGPDSSTSVVDDACDALDMATPVFCHTTSAKEPILSQEDLAKAVKRTLAGGYDYLPPPVEVRNTDLHIVAIGEIATVVALCPSTPFTAISKQLVDDLAHFQNPPRLILTDRGPNGYPIFAVTLNIGGKEFPIVAESPPGRFIGSAQLVIGSHILKTYNARRVAGKGTTFKTPTGDKCFMQDIGAFIPHAFASSITMGDNAYKTLAKSSVAPSHTSTLALPAKSNTTWTQPAACLPVPPEPMQTDTTEIGTQLHALTHDVGMTDAFDAPPLDFSWANFCSPPPPKDDLFGFGALFAAHAPSAVALHAVTTGSPHPLSAPPITTTPLDQQYLSLEHQDDQLSSSSMSLSSTDSNGTGSDTNSSINTDDLSELSFLQRAFDRADQEQQTVVEQDELMTENLTNVSTEERAPTPDSVSHSRNQQRTTRWVHEQRSSRPALREQMFHNKLFQRVVEETMAADARQAEQTPQPYQAKTQEMSALLASRPGSTQANLVDARGPLTVMDALVADGVFCVVSDDGQRLLAHAIAYRNPERHSDGSVDDRAQVARMQRDIAQLTQYATVNADQLNVASTADNALPLIDVYVNGTKVRALVDTGATRSFILKRAVPRLNVTIRDLGFVRDIFGVGELSTSHVADTVITVNGAHFRILPLIVDLHDRPYDIILGMDWIRPYRVNIDWITDTLYFILPATSTAQPVPIAGMRPTAQTGPTLIACKLVTSDAHPRKTSLCVADVHTGQEHFDFATPAPLHSRRSDPSLSIRNRLAARLARPRSAPASPFVSASPNPPVPSAVPPPSSRVSQLGQKLHKRFKNMFPALFREKVRFQPNRRWTHRIDTGDSAPIKSRGRPLSPPEHDAVKTFVDDGLRDGIIEPSESPWSSPILLVRKKTGEYRICVDYRKLNAATKKNAYPLPFIADCYQRLSGARHFSLFDLKSGYWQVPIAPDDRAKTAFTCRQGHFQFKVMPFGLCNAPATFQGMMNEILREYIDDFVLVYLDDIIVFSRDEEAHERHIQLVLSRLAKHDLVLSESKCHWAASEVEYLGHIVSGNGVRVNPNKVTSIVNWPTPDNITQVRGFLNLAGYYRRFITGFAKIASPMYDLLQGSPRKGSAIEWTPNCQRAFDELKTQLTHTPLLAHPELNSIFVIDTDASGDCIGAVLQQVPKELLEGVDAGAIDLKNFKISDASLHPIAYESRRMTPTETRYSAQEREMLAVVYSLQKWRQYVEGSPILVRSDHESLKYFHTQKDLGRRLTRFADDIAHFNVVIVYRPGKHQLAADALSRRAGHDEPSDDKTLAPLFVNAAQTRAAKRTTTSVSAKARPPPVKPAAANQTDEPGDDISLGSSLEAFATLRRWEHALATGQTIDRTDFAVRDQRLHRRVNDEWLIVPTSLADAAAFVHNLHVDLGHLAAAAVTHALRERAWFPDRTKIVADVLKRCDQCQFTRREDKPMQPLHPLPRPPAFERWAFDFIGPLPRSKTGMSYILTAMDHGTNWTYADALPARSAEAAVDMLRKIIAQHGKMLELLTDNGEEFLSNGFRAFLMRQNIAHLHTTPYHPQTNGRLEKFNDTLTTILARFTAPDQQQLWDKYLPDALLAYRSHHSQSLGASPFYLLYGCQPRLPHDTIYGTFARVPTPAELTELHRRRRLHVQNLERFRAEASTRALGHLEREAARRDETYGERGIGIGDLVKRRAVRASKLHPQWDGPFIVHDMTDKNVYQLATRGGYILKSLYNGERLARYHASNDTADLWYATADLQRRNAESRENRTKASRAAQLKQPVRRTTRHK